MRKSILLACLTLLPLASLLAADGVIRRLVWQVETSDPVPRNWPIVYGETFDMEVRYLDHTKPMDLTGGSVVLHCRTNGMATGYSFQATGSVMAVQGWATVRVAVDALLPPGLTEAAYVVAVTQGGTTNLLSAQGTFRLTGTSAGLNGSPLPASEIAALYSRVTSVSNALGMALSNSAAQLTSATGTLAQANAAALSALSNFFTSTLSTNRATRLYSEDGAQWIDGTGCVWRVSQSTELAYRITASELIPYQVGEEFWFVSDVTTTNATLVIRTISYGNLTHIRHGYTNGEWDSDGTWTLYVDGTGANDPAGTFAYPDIGTLYPGDVDPYATLESFQRAVTVTNAMPRVAFLSDVPSTNGLASAESVALSIAAIPIYPTNYVAGFAMPIPGTNAIYTLSVSSNGILSVWSVTP